MASEAELLALAERCEAASGPVEVAGLNGDILRALGWSSDAIAVYDPAGERRSGIPSYTTTLDGAMTLVPSLYGQIEAYAPDHNTLGWTVHLSCDANRHISNRSAFAQSYPLALCAAALRARAATMGGSDD